MDRRDFLKTTLSAIAASSVALDAHQGGGGPTIQLQMYCKGQFLHITENGKLYLACLTNTADHPSHLARIYVPVAALGESAPPGFEDVTEWRGYPLKGNIVLTSEDGSPLPQTPPATKSSAKANDERPFPDPPENDAEWNYREFVPQLARISPGCKLKSAWRGECESIFGPLQRNQLRIHKPCKKEDTVAVFVWRGPDNKPVRVCAASDLVSYPYFLSRAIRAVRLNIGKEIRVPLRLTGDPVYVAQICAPERRDPPARTAYATGKEVEHFQNIYRVVDLRNAKKARMYYLGQSVTPTQIHETTCLKPFGTKDDDIFCPGGEPPP